MEEPKRHIFHSHGNMIVTMKMMATRREPLFNARFSPSIDFIRGEGWELYVVCKMLPAKPNGHLTVLEDRWYK
jgi:hypothetical protein